MSPFRIYLCSYYSWPGIYGAPAMGFGSVVDSGNFRLPLAELELGPLHFGVASLAVLAGLLRMVVNEQGEAVYMCWIV